MANIIGNPLSWGAGAVAGTGRAMGSAADGMGSHETTVPETRPLRRADMRNALRAGLQDFGALRSDVMFLVAIYPIIGICLAVIAFDEALLPMLFPLAAGFALLGPIAAVGLYELSRRREAGENPGWGGAFGVFRANVLGPVVVLGGFLALIFVIWMTAAQAIYAWTMGPEPPVSAMAFVSEVLTTGAGWTMIVVGVAVGFVFACVVLATSLIAFPMLVDRRAGLPVAVATSFAVARRNPGPVALWGLIVAVALALGSIPLFLGLVFVLPVLGHATWHLYRAIVPRQEEV